MIIILLCLTSVFFFLPDMSPDMSLFITHLLYTQYATLVYNQLWLAQAYSTVYTPTTSGQQPPKPLNNSTNTSFYVHGYTLSISKGLLSFSLDFFVSWL